MTTTPTRINYLFLTTGSTTPSTEGESTFNSNGWEVQIDGYILDISEYRNITENKTAESIPISSLSGKIDKNWISDWYAMQTDCGDGSDGDFTIGDGYTVSLSRNVHYDTVTISGNGYIANSGWDFRARRVIISESDGYNLKAMTLSGSSSANASANTGGSSGSIATYYSRLPVGGGRRGAGGLNGVTGTGTSAGAVAFTPIGGTGGSSGSAGSGSAGAGGAGGTVTPKTANHFFDPEANILGTIPNTLAGSGSQDYLPLGSSQGGGGASGGGDGTNLSGGGGAAGHGMMVGRWRIGELIIGSNVSSPIFDSRGMNGGNGGTPNTGNCGGGSGGGGGGGGVAIVIIGKVTGSLTNAIDASSGNGGNGGNGVGTGTGGAGGAGGYGGYIYLKRIDTNSVTILDNSGTAGGGIGAASGSTGGNGGTGVITRLNL